MQINVAENLFNLKKLQNNHVGYVKTQKGHSLKSETNLKKMKCFLLISKLYFHKEHCPKLCAQCLFFGIKTHIMLICIN